MNSTGVRHIYYYKLPTAWYTRETTDYVGIRKLYIWILLWVYIHKAFELNCIQGAEIDCLILFQIFFYKFYLVNYSFQMFIYVFISVI